MRTMAKLSLASLLVLAAGAQLLAADDDDKTPIGQRRGLDNYQSGNSRTLVIVKGSGDAVIDALMKGNPTKQVARDLEKGVTLKSRSYLVLQIKGQQWTAVLNLTEEAVEERKLAAGLAAFLKTKAAFYSYSSFTDWTRYALFDGTKEIESLEGLDADSAKDMLALGAQGESRRILEAIRDNHGPLLNSTLRKLNPGEKEDPDKFVDRALKAEGAYLPDLAGDFKGKAGQKFEMDEPPAEKKDIAALAIIMGDAAPPK
jgi:hypothetical protein